MATFKAIIFKHHKKADGTLISKSKLHITGRRNIFRQPGQSLTPCQCLLEGRAIVAT